MDRIARRALLAAVLVGLAVLGRASMAAASDSSQLVVECEGRRDTLQGHARTYALDHGLPRDLLAGIAWRESRWNPTAVNTSGRWPASGLMQIVVRWHPRMLGKTLRPCPSMHYAAHYMGWLLWVADGDLDAALAAYSGNTRGYAADVRAYMEAQAQARG